MTISEAFDKHPYNEDEFRTKQEYCVFIGNIIGSYNYENIGRYHRRHVRSFKETKRTINNKGEIISSTERAIPQDEIEDLSGYQANKLTTNPYGGQWVKYEKKDVDYVAEIQNVFKDIKLTPFKPFKQTKSDNALKITLSDMHVGMSCNDSLFMYKYGKDEFINSLNDVFNSAVNMYKANGKFDELIIQDLGDSLDGYNKQTTRGGHDLEQNMSNAEAFRTYVEGKFNLISSLYMENIANKISVHNSVNCNHSGDFGYSANFAIKMALEQKFKDIEYNIYQKFITHFYYGEHCFIQTHGKDKQYMKSGMPLKLDDRTQNYINQYIDRMGITSKYIHFEKGDWHQVSYQRCKKFDYRNFMSLAPPSNWVQHNFADGYSGYSIQVIGKDDNQIVHIDYFVDYTV